MKYNTTMARYKSSALYPKTYAKLLKLRKHGSNVELIDRAVDLLAESIKINKK